MLNRRSFLAQSAAASLLAQSPELSRRPNILWISCEDTGPQLGCYGDKYALTPNLDKLAAQGVRYTRAYTVAGVCAPSRSGIITGMYPSTLGSQYMRCRIALPAEVKILPEHLRNAGYYCTNNVKTDYNFDVPPNAWDEVSRKAHWKSRKANQPFFAVFNLETTHESRVRMRGEEYAKVTDRLTSSERRDPTKAVLPPYYPDTPESRKDWVQYYELITTMDKQAGDLLKELEENGQLENTIVFFWGDHGVGLPRAKRWLYETSTHAPLVVRVPEKFRTRGQGKPGSADDQLLSFIDLAPTVLNLAQVPVPSNMQGRAFLGANLTAPRKYVYGARDRMDESYDSVRMVRDSRYRYLRNYEPHKPYAQKLAYMEQGHVMKELRRLAKEGKTPEAARLFMGETKPVEELYDTQNDPFELKNLASDPSHKATLERLRAAHHQWQLESRDLGLIPEPEVEARGVKAGTRYQILKRPESDRYLTELRRVADHANRKETSALEAYLNHDDPAYRYWAVVGLASAGVPASKLVKLVTDPAPVVRIAAARAMGAVDLLVEELNNPNDFAALHAAQALESLGKRAEPARSALTAIVKGKRNEYVTRVAVSILENLS